MNIEYRRKTNLDIDVERQIRAWPLSAIVILILPTIWKVVFLFSKDPDGIFLAAPVSLFYAFGLLLFRVNQFILARSVWLFGASASNLVALVFAHPLTNATICFCLLLRYPFLPSLGKMNARHWFCLSSCRCWFGPQLSIARWKAALWTILGCRRSQPVSGSGWSMPDCRSLPWCCWLPSCRISPFWWTPVKMIFRLRVWMPNILWNQKNQFSG